LPDQGRVQPTEREQRNLKNTLPIAALVLVALFGFYLLFVYYVLRDKTSDVSKFVPYAQVVGPELTLLRPMTLVAISNKSMYYEHPHHLVEADARRAEWETLIATLPAGARIRFEKTLHIKTATSGVISSILFGQTDVPESGRKIAFEYRWGQQRENPFVPPAELYWTFPQAPWQREAITEKFIFDAP